MEGFRVTFFTQQSREHQGKSVACWIVDEAKKLGTRGATLFTGKAGFGHDGRFHSSNLFDLEDPPLQVVLILTPQECDKLFARIETEKLRVFYTKSLVEYGVTSE